MPGHIIIGLPHQDWKKNRGIDYTFSHSKNEYDNESVDSLTYNATNSGGGVGPSREHQCRFIKSIKRGTNQSCHLLPPAMPTLKR